MTCDVQATGTIELFFYGELSSMERAAVQSHLRQCAECRRVLEDLSVIRAALASCRDIATPPGGHWSAFMARIDQAVQQRPHGAESASALSRPTAPLRTSFAPYLALAATLLLITIGVLVALRQGGRGEQVPADPAIAERPSAAGTASAPERRIANAVDPGLVTLTGQHFERSKLVVLGLATKDPRGQDRNDWAYERDLASTLLGDTRLYRRAAEHRGMTTLAGVMRDLELVLLQTSMSEQSDADSLEQLQRLIRRRDLLTKMNAVYVGGP